MSPGVYTGYWADPRRPRPLDFRRRWKTRIARHDPARIFKRAEEDVDVAFAGFGYSPLQRGWRSIVPVICSVIAGALGLLAMPVFAEPQAVNIVQDPAWQAPAPERT